MGLYLCSTKRREGPGGPREISWAEGMDFPIPPELWWSTDILSSIFLQGVDQKILPCGQGRLDSVKINPSLLSADDERMFDV